MMGADNEQAHPDEYPKHKVILDGFWIDTTEVTNGQFREFTQTTGYITTAEQKPNWKELKKLLPKGTPKPDDEDLIPGSLVFVRTTQPVPLNNPSKWWKWLRGASWRRPLGDQSSVKGMDDFPVVHVSWYDAEKYCKWKGKRLPTEAQWESAARGGLENKIYPWGNEHIDKVKIKANTWQGEFPYQNTKKDKFFSIAPVKSFMPNDYGLYDMSGNVREWVSDWYHADYYKKTHKEKGVKNPKGPRKSFDPQQPEIAKRVQRGGSFLSNDSYSSGYRVAARMRASPDTSLIHSGFRCARSK